ncbi:hypothetical protein [Bacillus sp. FJAT-45037]|uniref:hypothetical protein n=1 Tax=Bacillus sp. FJAT-45037 TaxID=2011007 RepID=UPI000C236B9C|nr:hypothetical protein [Bacillus sp. FJAT-45037]
MERYLCIEFGIIKEDILISPISNKKVTIEELINKLEDQGIVEQVMRTIGTIKFLGRKGVITYLTKLVD